MQTPHRTPGRIRAFSVGVIALILGARELRLDRLHPFCDLAILRPAAATVMALGTGAATARRGSAAHLLLRLVAISVLVELLSRGRQQCRRPRQDGGVRPDLILLMVNTRDGRADPAALAGVVLETGAGLVCLVESGIGMATRLRAHLIGDFRSWSSIGPGRRDLDGVALLASASTGPLAVTTHSDTRFPYLEVTGPALHGRRLMIFHAVAPVPPGSISNWLSDHRRLAAWCRSEDALVAGDLNSTLDHSVLWYALGNCRDAARVAGRGLVATWPSALPRWAGAQLDHVVVPPGVSVIDTRIVDIAGSDHRGLLVHLRLGDSESQIPGGRT